MGFLELWHFAARAARKRGQKEFFVTTELLPGDYQYPDEQGRVLGHLWEDTLELRRRVAAHLS